MWFWHRATRVPDDPASAAERIRSKYNSFRELLTLNNECLELMAGLQEDLQYVPPLRDVLNGRIADIFDRIHAVVASLEELTGVHRAVLTSALQSQQNEIERYSAGLQESTTPRLAAWLSELGAASEPEVGSKAAMLGEIRNHIGLPVPDGFVLTTEAYRQYCGIPLWDQIRDATRHLDVSDHASVRHASDWLGKKVLAAPLPRAVEVAIAGRARTILKNGGTLAVRSSAVGEGGAQSYAGQFASLLNVTAEQTVDAYRSVIASRFNERALFYRLSTGLLEIDTPMAALFLLMVPARAAGIMYTRNPADLKGGGIWISATRGLGAEIASGHSPADLFVVTRGRPVHVTEREVVRKDDEVIPATEGGTTRVTIDPVAAEAPSIDDEKLCELAHCGILIEEHFGKPQDVEWVLDVNGKIWIVQSRPLVHTEPARARSGARPKVEPRISGGRTIYPGRTSGPVFLVEKPQDFSQTPGGAIAVVRRPSPEIIEVFPRIAGLIAEWGNVAGHAAALLREFRIPSVFQMTGVFSRLSEGETVSLDAVQAKLYPGTLWPPSRSEAALTERYLEKPANPIARSLLSLTLLDPAAVNFRASGCKSAHDILRYCHEKAIEAMFAVNDIELEQGSHHSKVLVSPIPLNVLALDLGGGLASTCRDAKGVKPGEILSRPFQAFWKGIAHPGVSWTREMPAHISDLASVVATALTPQSNAMRPLGDRSYLLVASEYMNLNSRLAYHYSLVDACLSDIAANNYISFRFEGGGSTRPRRNLRACFIADCLKAYGFHADRRGDLVNAWLRKAPAAETAEKLDILGRLVACSSQLDMYMTSREVMRWYARQFLAGNYSLSPPKDAVPAS